MTVRRTDYSTLRKPVKTPEGFLLVDAAVTRVGVLRYTTTDGQIVREFKPPEEVLNPSSMASLKEITVTDGHPPEWVTADNWKQYSVGIVRESPHDEGGLLMTKLLIQDQSEIALIESGERVECSVGYDCTVDMTPGYFNGEYYDGVQRNVRYNHVGLGPKNWGRAGPKVSLRLNSAHQLTENIVENTRESVKQKLKIGGRVYHCDSEADMEAAQEQATKINADMEALSASVDKLTAALTAAQAEVAALKEQLAMPAPPPDAATMDSVLNNREKLRNSARLVLGNDAKLDGLKTREIHAKVINCIDPQFDCSKRSDEFLEGKFEGIVSQQTRVNAAETRQNSVDGSPQVALLGNPNAPAVNPANQRKDSAEEQRDFRKRFAAGRKAEGK